MGFSPLVAVTTSNKHSIKDIDFEHNLESFYDCNLGPPAFGNCGSLNPPADENFVVGILDSGSVVDLVAGSGAFTLGLDGAYLTQNVVPIGGIGGTVDALISQPVGFYAAGLGAVEGDGTLDRFALHGHSNVSAVVAPPLDCGGGEIVRAVIGTPFLSFFTTVIRVDTPRRVTVEGETFIGPDVRIQDQLDSFPEYPLFFAMAIGGISPVTTASYFPEFEDLVTPLVPTLLSLTPLSFPTGGVFFANVQGLMGEPSFTNLPITMRLMVDTGAQSSIISPAVAADLSLPLEPDFTVDACGIGGVVEDIPGYFIDYIQINASGGPMKFSRSPFVVLDLTSPEGGPLDGVLGMNFFWNRNVIFEPSLTTSSFFHVSDPIPVAFGDFNVDLRVDAFDSAVFTACSTSPQAGLFSPECEPFDADGDGSIDLRDYAKFQNCASGEEFADPDCGG